MPSKTAKQARLMAAVAHGWKPDRIKGPPVKVAKEFNDADKGRFAHGGMVKPPGMYTQAPALGHTQSPLGQAIQNKGNAGRYGGGMGLAPARPPRVPMVGMFRNIDQGLKKSKVQLRALGGSLNETGPTEPAPQGPDEQHVHELVMTALQHLQGLDASSAAAVLRSSPEAMAHPEIAAVVHALQNSTGITPATKTLNQISQVGSGSPEPQMQQLLPPLQNPAGAQPAGGQPPPQTQGMPSGPPPQGGQGASPQPPNGIGGR